MSTRDQAVTTGCTVAGATRIARKRGAWIVTGTLAKCISLPVLFLAGVAVLNFWSLLRVPAISVDEAWFANRAYALINTGYGFGALDAGVPDRIPGYWAVLAWIQPLIESIPIRLLGVSLFTVRLESLVFGIALLAVVYVIVRELYNRRAAFITMAVAAFSPAFIFASHMARPDLLVALCGFGAVALYVSDRSSGLTPRSVMSGLLIGLALDIHLNIVIFGPVMLGLFMLDYGRRMFRTGRFWGFVTGASTGLAFYVAIHILPYPSAYMEVNRLESGLSQTPTLLRPEIWLSSIQGTANLLGILSWPIILVAVVALLKRRTQSDKRLLVIFTALVGSFAVIRPYWHTIYMILLAPAVWLLTGALIDYIITQPWRRTLWVYARIVLVAGLVLTRSLYAVGSNVG